MNTKSYKGFSNVVVILVGVLVVAILVGFFRVTRPFSGINLSNGNTNGTLTDTKNSNTLTGASVNCDIAVTSPAQNAKVSSVINISGIYNNCGWNNTTDNYNNIANIGTVVVVDGKGNTLTNTLNITSNLPGSFNITIGLVRPSQTTGAVIIVRNSDNEQPITIQIPVTISR